MSEIFSFGIRMALSFTGSKSPCVRLQYHVRIIRADAQRPYRQSCSEASVTLMHISRRYTNARKQKVNKCAQGRGGSNAHNYA